MSALCAEYLILQRNGSDFVHQLFVRYFSLSLFLLSAFETARALSVSYTHLTLPTKA